MLENNKDIVVIGIGNTLMTDDGTGVFAVHELMERYVFPENVEFIDGGTKGLELLPFVEGKKKALFIDAVDMMKTPGSIGEIAEDEIPEYFVTRLSVHQIALPDLIGAGNLLGTLPEEMHLIGIQPESVETGYGMTPSVKKGFNNLITRVLEKLEEWGIRAHLKDNLD